MLQQENPSDYVVNSQQVHKIGAKTSDSRFSFEILNVNAIISLPLKCSFENFSVLKKVLKQVFEVYLR